MGELAREILPVYIEDEMKQSYLDYAMSELKNSWNKPYLKSARVVGDVKGK